jgi:hypothetical protein
MGAIAKRLGVRIDDGVLFPYTELTEKQHNMRPWNGPMEKDWLIDTREARLRRLRWLEEDRGTVRRVEQSKPFNIATADKDELIEFVANEYGEQLDARLPVLELRRRVIAMATRQVESAGMAEVAEAPAEVSAPAEAPAEAPTETQAYEQAAPQGHRSRGLGRKAA